MTPTHLRIGRECLQRPFIEKPVNADDHNIWIYQPDGKVCKLFRKIANKCSETVNEEDVSWRGGSDEQQQHQQSYVYEEFLSVDGGEDIKVYTVGPNYAYAESRKSPFIDGIVRRNAQGKEIRTVTALTEEEHDIARRICMAFGQTVCGFDMVRSEGRSYVIDINGWSFVKGSDTYYDKAAKILKDTFIQVARRKRRHSALGTQNQEALEEFDSGLNCPLLESDISMGQWRLKGYVGVLRHADRTPKQKLKVTSKNPKLREYFKAHLVENGENEVILRTQGELEKIKEICREDCFKLTRSWNLESDSEDAYNGNEYDFDKIKSFASSASLASTVESLKSFSFATKTPPGLEQIFQVLEKKIKVPGTKIQLRQVDSEEAILIILKWGGEFTHAGRHQSKDSGDNLRKDLTILNKRVLDDVRVFSSNERRVQATAQVFSKAFFPIVELPDNFVTTWTELLDDHLVDKNLFDSVKMRINSHISKDPLIKEILSALKLHRDVFERNFELLDVQTIATGKRWCCSESPLLFKERWDKHFGDVLLKEPLDLSRMNDLYDSIRYDTIHHRQFLIQMFVGIQEGEDFDKNYKSFLKLFDDLHKLFRLITPLEYGFTRGERLKISKQISGKLLDQVVKDLFEVKETCVDPGVRLYFTKETHMHALLNLIRYSGIPLCRQQQQTSLSLSTQGLNSTSNTATSSIPNTPKTELKSFHDEFSDDDEEESESSGLIASPLLSQENEADLDYLSQICFEFYEKIKVGNDGCKNDNKNNNNNNNNSNNNDAGMCSRSYSLRIGVSSGAHDAHLFDLNMDSKHAVTVKSKTWITEYLDGEQVLSWLQTLVN